MARASRSNATRSRGSAAGVRVRCTGRTGCRHKPSRVLARRFPRALQPCARAPLAAPSLEAHPLRPNNKSQAKCHHRQGFLRQSCLCHVVYQPKVGPLPIPVLCPQSPLLAVPRSLFWGAFRPLQLQEVGRHTAAGSQQAQGWSTLIGADLGSAALPLPLCLHLPLPVTHGSLVRCIRRPWAARVSTRAYRRRKSGGTRSEHVVRSRPWLWVAPPPSAPPAPL